MPGRARATSWCGCRSRLARGRRGSPGDTEGVHLLKRFAVTIVGLAVLLVGVALMVLPGPGLLLLVVGLAVLATEYVWARTLLVRAQREAQKVQEAAVASRMRTAGSILFAVGMVTLGILVLLVRTCAGPCSTTFSAASGRRSPAASCWSPA